MLNNSLYKLGQIKTRGTQRFVTAEYLFGRPKSPEVFGLHRSENQRFLCGKYLTSRFRNKGTVAFGVTNMSFRVQDMVSSEIRRIGFRFLKFSAA